MPLNRPKQGQSRAPYRAKDMLILADLSRETADLFVNGRGFAEQVRIMFELKLLLAMPRARV
jgi:hypothetical protein